MTLLKKIADHAMGDSPGAVMIFEGADAVINVVLAPKWWAEIVPAREDHRIAGAKWVLSKFGGIPKRPVAAVCEWDILVWLSEVWREA